MTDLSVDYKTHSTELVADIKRWALELGFQEAGISDINLSQAEKHLQEWLAKKFHGSMDYMEKHGEKRSRPATLIPGTLRVISVRMDYLPANPEIIKTLQNPNKAYISRYALGRDYHKLIRQRLNILAKKITAEIGTFGYRVFVDSAPVLEKAIAEKAGLGWIGKNTLLLNKQAGSWFFLGEIYTDLPLPLDQSAANHCGSCNACIEICPTQAIVGPYQLDARRCISYLTIENRGAIPLEFRDKIGNRIFGCDDCQLICPWNKFAKPSQEKDFQPRHGLNSAELLDLFLWSEAEFLQKTEGSALRRTGYEGWLRNIAVALGNSEKNAKTIAVLQARYQNTSPLVQEHIAWALDRLC